MTQWQGSADALVFRHPGPGKDVIVNFKHIEVLVDHLHADLGTRHQDFLDQFYALQLVLSLSELPCDLLERLERVQGKRVQYPGLRRNDLGQLLAKAVIVRGDDQEIRGFFFNGLAIIIEHADVRVRGKVSRVGASVPNKLHR